MNTTNPTPTSSDPAYLIGHPIPSGMPAPCIGGVDRSAPSHTSNALAIKVGSRAGWRVESGIVVDVEILNARSVFGRTDYHCRICAGSGVRWIPSDKLTAAVCDDNRVK